MRRSSAILADIKAYSHSSGDYYRAAHQTFVLPHIQQHCCARLAETPRLPSLRVEAFALSHIHDRTFLARAEVLMVRMSSISRGMTGSDPASSITFAAMVAAALNASLS